MGELSGRVALVTGGGRGLGRAICQALDTAGAAVAVAARSRPEVEAVAAELGGRSLAVPLDVADAAAIPGAVRHVEHELGPVDVLVANAGVVWPLGRLLQTDPGEWERAVEINLFGVVRCVRAVLPGMLERGWGRIVIVSSGAARGAGMPSASAYSAGKAAADSVTANLGAELGGSGVLVTGVRPGVVDTGMQEYMRSLPREQVGDPFADRFAGLHERGELVDPADPARLVLALALSNLTGVTVDLRDDDGKALLAALGQPGERLP